MAWRPRPARRHLAAAAAIAAVLAIGWLVLPGADSAPSADPATLAGSAASTPSAGPSIPADPTASTLRAEPSDAPPLVVALDFVVPVYQGGAERFRTPATIDTALAEDLGKRLRRPVTIVGPADATGSMADRETAAVVGADGPAARRVDVRIAPLDGRPLPPEVETIPLDYRASPMAIMRTDSPIRHWDELQGRTVCVAAGGQHVGDLARQYGAIEIVHPSPTDALVAVRVGECDAMVHDSAMLEKLIRLPEWRKFSRTLPARPVTTLALLAPRGEPALARRLQRIAADWKTVALVDGLVANAVRNIAFEVYLQQDVPDCH